MGPSSFFPPPQHPPPPPPPPLPFLPLWRSFYPPLLRPYLTNQTNHQNQHQFSTISIVFLTRSVKVLSSKYSKLYLFSYAKPNMTCASIPTKHLLPVACRCFLLYGFCICFINIFMYFLFFVFRSWVCLSYLYI
jgi:hypothetical protein